MTKYRIRCWIPAEPPEDEEIYQTRKEAKGALEHYQLMNPENYYLIEKVEDEEDGLEGKVGDA